jgi:hypothetical protein
VAKRNVWSKRKMNPRKGILIWRLGHRKEDLVGHAYNSSSSGDRDQEKHSLRPAQAKSL